MPEAVRTRATPRRSAVALAPTPRRTEDARPRRRGGAHGHGPPGPGRTGGRRRPTRGCCPCRVHEPPVHEEIGAAARRARPRCGNADGEVVAVPAAPVHLGRRVAGPGPGRASRLDLRRPMPQRARAGRSARHRLPRLGRAALRPGGDRRHPRPARAAPTTTPATTPTWPAMKERFLASEWADRTPAEIEIAVETVIDGIAVRGRIDAVFRRADGGGCTIVDWKTGGQAERGARARRVRCSSRPTASPSPGCAACELGEVDAAFYYAGTGETVWPELPDDGETRAGAGGRPGLSGRAPGGRRPGRALGPAAGLQVGANPGSNSGPGSGPSMGSVATGAAASSRPPRAQTRASRTPPSARLHSRRVRWSSAPLVGAVRRGVRRVRRGLRWSPPWPLGAPRRPARSRRTSPRRRRPRRPSSTTRAARSTGAPARAGAATSAGSRRLPPPRRARRSSSRRSAAACRSTGCRSPRADRGHQLRRARASRQPAGPASSRFASGRSTRACA